MHRGPRRHNIPTATWVVKGGCKLRRAGLCPNARDMQRTWAAGGLGPEKGQQGQNSLDTLPPSPALLVGPIQL